MKKAIFLLVLFLSAGFVFAEPQAVYPNARYNRENGILTLGYVSNAFLTVQVPKGTELITRQTSDGCFVSTPLVEQFYLSVPEGQEVRALLTFHFKGEALCMKPKRAKEGEAILAQVGYPLIYGVNGIYSVMDDLMIDWTDADWYWLFDRIDVVGRNNYSALLEVKLTSAPWVINIRPLYYKEHLGYRYHEPWRFRPNTKPIAGWCSWLAYYTDISEARLLEVADMLKEKFQPYGLEYLQIDDGYQEKDFGIKKDKTLSQSWLAPTEGFPKGITHVARLIDEKGLKPGVWMNTDIKAYDPPEGAKDVVFKNPDGSFMYAAWLSHANDCSDESLKKTLAPLWEKLAKAGYVYIKIDALRHTWFDALGNAVKKGYITMEEARRRMRRLFEVAREKAGEDTFLLSCWGTFTESVGMVDASRISTDANPNWERLLMQQYELARFWPLQRILYQLDPDHIIARTQPNWVRATLSTVSLCGGLFMISDPIQSYDEKLTHSIQRVLPVLPTYPAETSPIDFSAPSYANHIWTGRDSEENPINDKLSGHFPDEGEASPFGTLWVNHIRSEFSGWAVLQRNALWKLPEAEIDMKGLGLNPKREFLVFDFWAGKYLGTVSGKISLPAMRTGDSITYIIRRKTNHPQVLGTSRHIAGGYVEVLKEDWDGKTLEIELQDQPEDWTLYVYKPEAYEAEGLTANLSALTEDQMTTEGEVVKIKIKAGSDTSKINIAFKQTDAEKENKQ